MAQRIPGPDPPAKRITAEEAGERMVWSWAADRRTPVFDGMPLVAHAAIDWPSLYIVHDHPMRSLVTLWAWCEANGEPFRPKAEARGWKWSTARRRLMRGLQMIADGLTRDVLRSQGKTSP